MMATDTKMTKKEKILVTATSEFLNNGYIAGSTNTIAKDADVAKGLIFHYFGKKEKLYLHVLNAASEKLNRVTEQALLSLSTYMEPFDLMHELIVIKHSLPLLEPDAYTLLQNAFTTRNGYSDELDAHINEVFNQYNAMFFDFLNSLEIQERLRVVNRNDFELYHRLFTMLDAAFTYEKEKLPVITSVSDLQNISLKYYENILRSGIVISR